MVDTSGQLLMPPKAAGDETLIRENLEKVARYMQALDLENPNPRSALRGKFTLEVMRRVANGTWVVAEPEAAGGLPVFADGEAFAFRITSAHDEAAHISLLDFQEGHALLQLFPPTGAMEKIAAKKTFEQGTTPVDAGDAWILRGFFADGATEQRETIKLFVTSTPADFSLLAQARTRGLGPTDALPVTAETSPLTALFRKAIGASAAPQVGMRAVMSAGKTPMIGRP